MPDTPSSAQATRILFVCMANICRSPMAEAVARSVAEAQGIARSYTFDSAGTIANFAGQVPDDRARRVAAGRGYSMSGIKARTIALRDFEKFDLILAMDRKILLSLQRICPEVHQSKIRLFLDYVPDETGDDVPDPYYGNLAGFEHVLDLCERAAQTLLPHTSQSDSLSDEANTQGGFLSRIREFLARHRH